MQLQLDFFDYVNKMKGNNKDWHIWSLNSFHWFKCPFWRAFLAEMWSLFKNPQMHLSKIYAIKHLAEYNYLEEIGL